MARRSQCSSAGDNPLDPNYLPPHYREEYRLAIDALIQADLEGYYGFLHEANVVDFLCRPEIEYIKGSVRGPRQIAQSDRRYVIGDGDGSSDTYWPIQSDLDAPGLDLGWPQPHRFVGPTEITTLVNPSPPETPSIKEQVRRMIKNAQQVVAVAMDMFTDVDIFADILSAAMRNVAVYVLLDELNAHHFVSMANNCRVNLEEIKFLRVRTVAGSTYFCHTGMSFKGQMTNRFILVDCRIVLSGNYSFMWSFEKIHRCLAHVFLGELVATFDEEFRILYAQSEPLVVENYMAYVEDYGSLPERHNIGHTQMLKREYPPIEDIRAGWPGRSTEDPMNVRSKILTFRRGDSILSSSDEHLPLPAHAMQQFRGELPYADQRRLMTDPNAKEMGGFKRHGYTGIPGYRQMNAVNTGEQHMEGLEVQSAHFPREQFFNPRTGPDPSYEMYGKSRDPRYHQFDQFSEPDFPQEMDDAEGDYDHVQRYLHSCPAVEPTPAGNLLIPVQPAPRRHSRGQSYTCQTSPTQPNPPDQKYFFNVHHKRQDQKEGLRDWRISSYLTALQHPGQEDMADLQRTDSFDSITYAMQARPCEPEIPEIRQDSSEFTQAPASKVKPLPLEPVNTLSMPEKSLDLPVDRKLLTYARPTPPTTSESSCNTEGDKLEELQNREPKEANLIREEFVRRRPNLALQRSSRLRHSLIFSSNLEQHTSEDSNNPLNQNDGDSPLKHSSIVSNILEKKKPATKEPFQWTSLVKSCDSSSDSALKTDSEDLLSKEETSEGDKSKTTDILLDGSEQNRSLSQRVQPQDALTQNPQITQLPSAALQRSASFIDMNDPESRLRYFKELAAKRKAELALANSSTKDKPSKEPDAPKKSLLGDVVDKEPALTTPENPQATTATVPAATQKLSVGNSQDCKKTGSQNLPDKQLKLKVYPDPKTTQELISPSSCKAIPTSATDAEKIKLKQQLTDSSSNTVEDKSSGVQLGTNPKLTSPILNIPSPEFLSLPTKLSKVTDPGFSSSPSVQTPQNVKADSISSQVVTDVNMSLQPRKEPSSADFSPANAVVANKSTSKHSPAKETGLSQHSPAKETGLSQHPTAKETGLSQHSPAKETGLSQHSPAKETGLSQHPTAKETGLSQHSPAKETGLSQHSPAKETGLSQHSPAKETGLSQHSPAKETGLSQHSPAKETGLSQHPTAKETGLSQHSPAKETGLSQHSPAKETGLSQHSPAKETGLSQHSPAKEAGPSQHPTADETGPSQHSPAKEAGPSQHSPAKEAGPSQHPDVKEICPSHQPAPTCTAFSQQLNECSRPLNADPSKHPAEVGPSQHLTPTSPSKSDPALHSDPSEPSVQPSTNTVDTSPLASSTQAPSTFPISHPHASISSSSPNLKDSEHGAAKPTCTTHPTNPKPITGLLSPETTLPSNTTNIEFDLSQHASAAGHGFIPESLSTTKNCNKDSVNMSLNITPLDIKDMDPGTTPLPIILSPTNQSSLNTALNSTCPPEAPPDLSLMLTETNSARSSVETDRCSDHAAADLSPLLHTTSETMSCIRSTPSETDANISAETISAAGPAQTETSPSTEHSPAETSTCMKMTSPVDSSPTESEFPETGSATDAMKKDVGTSKNNSLANTSSTIEHSKSDLPPSSSSPERSSAVQPIQTHPASEADEIQTVTSTQFLVDTAQQSDSNSTSLVSVSLGTDSLKLSPSEACQPVNQPPAETQTSLNITQSGSPHDLASEERTDEDLNKEPNKEQTSQQEASLDSGSHVAGEVSVDLDKVDNTTAPSNNPQEPQPSTDVANQRPPAAEKPTLQASTVNVLACSNLRDDTKVLLEQISAKNQGRASKLTGTQDAKGDQAGGNPQINKQISGLSRSQTWSSKASPEEREQLLKKMESMRKEKRVYSRFEAS